MWFWAGADGGKDGVWVETAVGIVQADRTDGLAAPALVHVVVDNGAGGPGHHMMILVDHGFVAELLTAQHQVRHVALAGHQGRRHVQMHVDNPLQQVAVLNVVSLFQFLVVIHDHSSFLIL